MDWLESLRVNDILLYTKPKQTLHKVDPDGRDLLPVRVKDIRDTHLLVSYLSTLNEVDTKIPYQYACLARPMPSFPTMMSLQEVHALRINDKIDYRCETGMHYAVLIINRQATRLQIRYLEWRGYDQWIDSVTELHRFAPHRSISERPATRLLHLKVGCSVDINPPYTDSGWTSGEILKLHRKSGQVKVAYTDAGGQSHTWWTHRDNVHEIAEFRTETTVAANDSRLYEHQSRTLSEITAAPSPWLCFLRRHDPPQHRREEQKEESMPETPRERTLIDMTETATNVSTNASPAVVYDESTLYNFKAFTIKNILAWLEHPSDARKIECLETRIPTDLSRDVGYNISDAVSREMYRFNQLSIQQKKVVIEMINNVKLLRNRQFIDKVRASNLRPSDASSATQRQAEREDDYDFESRKNWPKTLPPLI